MLMPYLHGNTAPACPRRDTSVLAEEKENLPGYTGYVINGRLNRQYGNRQRSLRVGRQETILNYSGLTVILADARIGMISISKPDIALTEKALNDFFNRTLDPEDIDYFLAQPPGGTRHHGGANYAFADGHLKWMPPTALATTRKSDGVHPGFGL